MYSNDELLCFNILESVNKAGTLNAIPSDISLYFEISKQELIERIF